MSFPRLTKPWCWNYRAVALLTAAKMSSLSAVMVPAKPTWRSVWPSAACRQGKKVRFYTVAGLINELLEAQSQLRLGKLESTLAKCDLIVLDELGFVPFTKEGAEALFTFCSSRYERGSLVITTNLDFARWKEIFGDEALTGALLDRLTHRCHILEMNGDSYRFKESLRTLSTNPSFMMKHAKSS